MKTNTKTGLIVLIGVVAATSLAMVDRQSEADPRGHKATVSISGAARQRLGEMERINSLMSSGRSEEGISAATFYLSTSKTVVDEIEARRILARGHRLQHDLARARNEMSSAMALVDSDQSARAQVPWMKARINLDRADLEAFGEKDVDAAIALYDQVAQDAAALPSDRRVAVQNAAMLSAQAGRPAEAITRLDTMLASDIGARIGTTELINLRASKASWMAASGDAAGSIAAYKAIWDEFQGRNEASVLEAGLAVAQATPSSLDCEGRIRIARLVASKATELRAMEALPAGAPTADELADLEREALVIIADSTECKDLSLVNQARERLGLPRV